MQVAAVFALYIICTWIDPADPGVHRAKQKHSPQKDEKFDAGDTRKSLKTFLATKEEGYEPIETGCKPLDHLQLLPKQCTKRKREPEEFDPEEQSLYCSICDAEVIFSITMQIVHLIQFYAISTAL